MGSKTSQYSGPLVTYFVMLHILGVIGVWYAIVYPNVALVIMAIAYFFLCHLAITVGAHRYFTHKAFRTENKWVAGTLALFFSGTVQGTLGWWVAKHLQHHEYEDIPGMDPHTPKDGFFHSHMGWGMKTAAFAALPEKYVRRFSNSGAVNEIILWQTRHAVKLGMLMALLVPLFLGLIAGDVIGGLLIIGATRLVVQYHTTWVVNSVGHTMGVRKESLATNFGLFLTALVTVGESWHANHHESPAHWKLGRKWWQLDPGAWAIRLLSVLRLVTLKTPGSKTGVQVSNI